MRIVFKLFFYLCLLGLIGLIGLIVFAYLGPMLGADFSPTQEMIRTPVELPSE